MEIHLLKLIEKKTQKRYQEADKFLKHAIDRLAPDGYLAMLMPRSFLGAEASPELRKYLKDTCKILELWELPTEVFSGAIARTVGVFAQKRAENHYYSYNSELVRVRTLQPNTLNDFKASSMFTASSLANPSYWNENARRSNNSENTYLMDYKIILPEHSWQEIKNHCVNLNERAEIFLGAIVGKKPENKGWSNYEFPREVPWLTSPKNVLKRPFFRDYSQATTIIYPNELEKPRKNREYPQRDKEKILEGTKVLMISDPDSTWGRRVKVAIERKKHFVSNSFWVVAPNELYKNSLITHEVLAAVLNWDVSNAWIVEHLRYPWIPNRAIETIPFPRYLEENDCKILTEAIRFIENEARGDKTVFTENTREASHKIDAILKEAYHLDEATFLRLRQVIEWDRKPSITLDQLSDSDRADWILSGVVDDVDTTLGHLKLWLEGFDELQTVKIVHAMPGWMLRPNAAFRTKIPSLYVDRGKIDLSNTFWGSFYPQPYMYLSEEELVETLISTLYEDERNRV